MKAKTEVPFPTKLRDIYILPNPKTVGPAGLRLGIPHPATPKLWDHETPQQETEWRCSRKCSTSATFDFTDKNKVQEILKQQILHFPKWNLYWFYGEIMEKWMNFMTVKVWWKSSVPILVTRQANSKIFKLTDKCFDCSGWLPFTPNPIIQLAHKSIHILSTTWRSLITNTLWSATFTGK